MQSARSPYQDLPPVRFWRTGVAPHDISSIPGLYEKKFEIAADTVIATAGSCFAQHIARYLRFHGYRVLDTEPAPPALPADLAEKFGYGLFSARFGNIYVVRQLLQLFREAFGPPRTTMIVWEKDGRYFDAMRPAIEPEGLASPQEVIAHRQSHLEHVRNMFRSCNLFVFTLGLTETWIDLPTGRVVPTAPGTVAGQFDPARHVFKNLTYDEILADFIEFRQSLQQINPTVRFVLTVSPVPLTATATSSHVLLATTYSKSVLRAVAGSLAERFADVDYFPSYEVVMSHPSRGIYFEQNMRSVTPAGVEAVMAYFFREHAPQTVATAPPASPESYNSICEEILLDAFAK